MKCCTQKEEFRNSAVDSDNNVQILNRLGQLVVSELENKLVDWEVGYIYVSEMATSVL